MAVACGEEGAGAQEGVDGRDAGGRGREEERRAVVRGAGVGPWESAYSHKFGNARCVGASTGVVEGSQAPGVSGVGAEAGHTNNEVDRRSMAVLGRNDERCLKVIVPQLGQGRLVAAVQKDLQRGGSVADSGCFPQIARKGFGAWGHCFSLSLESYNHTISCSFRYRFQAEAEGHL